MPLMRCGRTSRVSPTPLRRKVANPQNSAEGEDGASGRGDVSLGHCAFRPAPLRCASCRSGQSCQKRLHALPQRQDSLSRHSVDVGVAGHHTAQAGKWEHLSVQRHLALLPTLGLAGLRNRHASCQQLRMPGEGCEMGSCGAAWDKRSHSHQPSSDPHAPYQQPLPPRTSARQGCEGHADAEFEPATPSFAGLVLLRATPNALCGLHRRDSSTSRQ